MPFLASDRRKTLLYDRDMPTTFLLKTEPSVYSFADLSREKKTVWSGVANAGALIHLRSARPGDECFIYHTGDERAIVGLARVASKPYEDPARPGKAPSGEPKHAVIDLAPVQSAGASLSLATMKADKRFAEFVLLRQSRLSVMPVPPALDRVIRSLTGL
jgi:predicted RNA-binding protein with PUA-like domain